jgi:NADH-quinone oxidoreductase subunit H
MSAVVDFFSTNFWALLALKLVIIAGLIPISGLAIGFGELKLSAKMQSRVGPYFAGGRYGWLQLIADGVKFIQKEDIIPEEADRPVFRWAPALVMAATVGLFIVIPFWPEGTIGTVEFAQGSVRNLDVGIFFALAISSLSTIGVLMAGWSSANKYSLMGGLRAAGQLIAYELPLVLSVIGVVIMAGTMSLQGIVDAQGGFSFFGFDSTSLGHIVPPFFILQFVGFVIFFTAALAEMSRIPFDMPIAESELVTGYLTEYSGFRFLFFFLAEFANMFTMSALAVTLFLGGYLGPGVETYPALGPLYLVSKISILVFLMIWFRWTFPRFREDQLQNLAWKVLVPLGLANIVVTAILKVVV